MNTPDPGVDLYLLRGCMRCEFGDTPRCKVHTWKDELILLREIVLDSELQEVVKWGAPCYTLEGANVANISALRNYCCIGFFKGVLLKDDQNVLEKPGENSQSVRLLRFTSSAEVIAKEVMIRGFLQQAANVERQGIKVPFPAKNQLVYPVELEAQFDITPDFREAFEALTPGRRRGYLLHFTQPKQSSTRESRILKCMPAIFAGKGMHDR